MQCEMNRSSIVAENRLFYLSYCSEKCRLSLMWLNNHHKCSCEFEYMPGR